MAMISSYHQHLIDIDTLREKTQSAVLGLTLKQLISVGQKIGLTTRVVQVEPSLLHRLKCPAILHWGLSHYVVLSEVKGSAIVIHDPGRGVRTVSMKEVDAKLSGIALEVAPDASFIKVDNRRRLTLSHFRSASIKYRFYIVSSVGLALGAQLLALCMPYFFQLVIDKAVPRANLPLLDWLVMIFAGLMLLDWCFRHLRTIVVQTIGAGMNVEFSRSVFSHLINLPITFFEGRSYAEIAAKFVSLDVFREAFIEYTPRIMLDLFMVFGVLLVLANYHHYLLICAITFTAVYIAIRLLTEDSIKMEMEEAHYQRNRENAYLLDTVQNIQAMKAYSAASMRQTKYGQLMQHATMLDLRLTRRMSIFLSSKEMLTGAETLVSVYIIAHLIIFQQMTLGMVLAFLTYKRLFMTSAFSLTEVVLKARLLVVHLNRLSDVMLSAPETATQSSGGSGQMPPAPDVIRVTTLSHTYDGRDAPTFSNLSFNIEPGDRVVLRGPSGCGKTTFVRTFLRMIPIQSGSISIGGVNIDTIKRDDWLRQIGTVFQGDRLMVGSILENICVADEYPDREAARVAADTACVLEEIDHLPLGMETLVQDDFAILSAGQKQRILIARALYRSPQILVLDEGTANLDEPLEQRILTNLRRKGISIIHAAHRPQVIGDATKIVDFAKLA